MKPVRSSYKKQSKSKTRDPVLKELRREISKLKISSNRPRRRARRGQGLAMSKAPAAIGSTYKTGKASFKTSGPGSVVVTHREFLSVVPGTQDLSTTKFIINPGLSTTFPWLSYFSQSFEKFKIRKCAIHYVPTCSTQEQGTISMYTEYDVTDSVIQNIIKMANMEGAVTGNTWKPHSMRVEPRKFNQLREYLIRDPYNTPNDPLLYDPCFVVIATAGQGDTIDVGMLYCEYEIELLVVSTDTGLNLTSGILQFSNAPHGTGSEYQSIDLTNATLSVLTGDFPWHIDSNSNVVFDEAYSGVIIWNMSTTNGMNSSVVPISTGTSLPEFYQSVSDTVVSGDDTLVFWAAGTFQQGATHRISLLWDHSNPVNGYIAIYPCPPAWLTKPKPGSAPNIMSLMNRVLPEKEDVDDEIEVVDPPRRHTGKKNMPEKKVLLPKKF